MAQRRILEALVAGHPAERLVREAHFFLVWSCPQSVAGITLCELSRSEM